MVLFGKKCDRGRSARFKVEIIVTAGKMYQCREVVFSHVRYVHLGAESTVTFFVIIFTAYGRRDVNFEKSFASRSIDVCMYLR